jgi:hypothetical protein
VDCWRNPDGCGCYLGGLGVMAHYERPAHIRAGADVYVQAGRGAVTVSEGMRRAATLARNLGDMEVAALWDRQADMEAAFERAEAALATLGGQA